MTNVEIVKGEGWIKPHVHAASDNVHRQHVHKSDLQIYLYFHQSLYQLQYTNSVDSTIYTVQIR